MHLEVVAERYFRLAAAKSSPAGRKHSVTLAVQAKKAPAKKAATTTKRALEAEEEAPKFKGKASRAKASASGKTSFFLGQDAMTVL